MYFCIRKPAKYFEVMTAYEMNAELFRAMAEIADDETLMEKVLKYVKSLIPAKKTPSAAGWADQFVGAWKDDRTAEEIIDDIRSARTTNNLEAKL